MRDEIKVWSHFDVVIKGKLQTLACQAVAFLESDPGAGIRDYEVEDFSAWWEDGVDFRITDYALLFEEDTERILDRLTGLCQEGMAKRSEGSLPSEGD